MSFCNCTCKMNTLTMRGFVAFYLCSCRGSVAVEFSVGLDVVGIYHQCLSVQLVGSFIVVVLKCLVALLFLGF